MKKRTRTCRCHAYPFPHRYDGGACSFETRNPEADEQSNGRASIDDYLDDPRHGQAKYINAMNRRYS